MLYSFCQKRWSVSAVSRVYTVSRSAKVGELADKQVPLSSETFRRDPSRACVIIGGIFYLSTPEMAGISIHLCLATPAVRFASRVVFFEICRRLR